MELKLPYGDKETHKSGILQEKKTALTAQTYKKKTLKQEHFFDAAQNGTDEEYASGSDKVKKLELDTTHNF